MKLTFKSIIAKCKILGIVLSLNFGCFSQDCEFSVNTKDKFTKQVKIELEALMLLKKYEGENKVQIAKLEMILKNEEGSFIFTLKMSRKGNGLPQFNKFLGDKLVLLLDNGSQLELEMTGLISSDYINKDMYTHFKLKHEEIDLLMDNKITDIRVMTSINPFDFVVQKEVDTRKSFRCCDN